MLKPVANPASDVMESVDRPLWFLSPDGVCALAGNVFLPKTAKWGYNSHTACVRCVRQLFHPSDLFFNMVSAASVAESGQTRPWVSSFPFIRTASVCDVAWTFVDKVVISVDTRS